MEKIEEFKDYSASEVLYMLKDLPDACCVFRVMTDPFGTVHDMQFIFVNEKYASLVGKPTAELMGATYYTTVANRDEDWIRLSYQAAVMRQSVINRTFNTQFNKWFEFWAVPVYKKGFCAFIIHDVTAEKRKEENQEIVSNSNNLILDCAKVLSTSDFKRGIKATLKALGTKIKADRVYIVESKGGDLGDIYEWTDKKSGTGLPNRKDFERFDFFTMWDRQLLENRVVIVNDTKEIIKKNKEVYEDVLQGTISRYIITAIQDKSETIGYLVADNFSLYLDINLAEVFETVAIFISEELRNYILGQEMQYMSSHDAMTNLRNRNAFTATLNMIEGMKIPVGVCFADINGLKAINDDQGHDAGDEYIKEAGAIVESVFKKKYSYRIGGDEFIAIVPQVEKEYFEELVAKLRKKCKKVSMAIGAVWQENAENIEEMINSADKLMYNDKAEFYSANNDRRH
ncbi:sensor domain-containing diguanylate cyclase [Pseudobutyrivibrio ruminis]|uniref:Diguanylate cyclase (GGDEF) domain-containing protein n=1 Tax=Pseudobutyrivibrio ruminis DSM 9787 TaxID=1123011 RepID=A0A285SPG6_9FIRM|nr:sensor domain-containing diguanylate cyclase [Pseudobutyrivibrio ruminis]SOC10121.1 diguanylate cyclase (GGDEF) domain-containing protein [Pseudobutyrivibrio ruminis DSM 9787]